jgi:hypothetical protein
MESLSHPMSNSKQKRARQLDERVICLQSIDRFAMEC